jgi:pimeloyl-ACP methyl ester carboxylesterase
MKARLGREKAPMTSPARPSSHIAAGRYAPVNGLQLYYEVYGTGRPLVLLHGGLMTIDLTFGPLIPALAEDHQVIGIELQGHGHTADIDRPMAIEILADDVVTLLGQLGIEQADFFGFSLGGLVDLALVLTHPGLVGKLVVASADYRSRPPAADADPRRMMPSESDFQAMRDAYDRVAPDPGHFAEIMAKTSAMVAAFEGWPAEEIRAITAPTLLLVGDTDFIRLENAVEMFELIPDAQLAVLPAATHVGVMQRRYQVLSLVCPFLDPAT